MKFFEYNATKAWVTDTDIVVELNNGRQASLPLKKFPLLYKASLEDRKKFEIIKGYALHWPKLGEDLSIAGFFEKESTSKDLQPVSTSTE